MEKSRLKMTKNMRFRQAEFTASTLRFRTMCTATLGDGNDVENRDLIESGSCLLGLFRRSYFILAWCVSATES